MIPLIRFPFRHLRFLLWAFVFLLSLVGQAQTVYVTKTGKKYHADGCQYLRRSAYAMTLADATSAGYDACSRCSPGNSASGQAHHRKRKSYNRKATNPCHGITKKGKPCSRRARPGSDYCYQHGG